MYIQIEIHDVGHGHCAVITAPNGRRIMVDSGTRNRNGRLWWPSIHHFGDEIAMKVVQNLDEDHLRDFGPVLKHCRVKSVLSNPTIGSVEFMKLKNEGMGSGARAYLDWLNLPRNLIASNATDFGGLQWAAFWNSYGGPCETTNDLSLAFFVSFGRFRIMFAGDLEDKGWHGMLMNPNFRELVKRVNIFVASHHGRESGCHDELFDLMTPEIIIISDDAIQYDTQETNSWYRQRCIGAGLILDPSRRRYVMTTRSDGTMRITAAADGLWRLTPNIRTKDYPLHDEPSDPNGLLQGTWNALMRPTSGSFGFLPQA